MRFVAYRAGGRRGLGVRRDGEIVATGLPHLLALLEGGADGLACATRAIESGSPLEGATLEAPLRPTMLLCSGVNYAGHAEENPGATMPLEPFFFAKLPRAVIGPDAPIVLPLPETEADLEVELALVIGVGGRRIPESSALEHVFGYTILNDVSARDVQVGREQLTLGKGVDTFAPLGPEVVTRDELGDASQFRLSSSLNGVTMQDASTSDMLFGPARLVSFVSELVTLAPGDVISTGTPAGCGLFRTPPVYLRPGDVVTASIEGIGELRNPVEAGW